ncbi:MAG: RHS repeat-associated core domain-containing protein, partial [Clostridiales bacterium]|nr:RHS repeat-associated core domain-containing protein [Clostridiales bacterium]
SKKQSGSTYTETTNYSYDHNGNLVLKYYHQTMVANGTMGVWLEEGENVLETFGYDGLDRLVWARVGGVEVGYTYRSDGLRANKWIGGMVDTRYVWDGWNISAELGQQWAVEMKYIRGLALICSENFSGTRTYYLYNAHGDVIQLANSSGAVVKDYRYDAFGKILSETGSYAGHNPFLYCGEYFDKETGTVYLRARNYDPGIGRFTQQDGWGYANPGDPLSLNLYTYCYGNPVMWVDPSGHLPVFLVPLIIGIIIAGAATGAVIGGINAYNNAVAADRTGFGLFFDTVDGAIRGGFVGGLIGMGVAGIVAAGVLAGPAILGSTFGGKALVLATGGTVITGAQILGGAAVATAAVGMYLMGKNDPRGHKPTPRSWVNKDMGLDALKRFNGNVDKAAKDILNNQFPRGWQGKGAKSDFNAISKWLQDLLKVLKGGK